VSTWPSTKARQVLAALKKIGWRVQKESSSHKQLVRPGWQDYTFAFHDSEEIGPRMISRIAKKTGLKPGDL
jgi:predicted RNA binding protein YcfA (HicA-like mRNA interferase family)